MRKKAPLKPLKNFNYKLVEEGLDGLLLNVDRDLQRRTGLAEDSGDKENARCLALLDILVRFSSNSYHAVRYLVADAPEDAARKPSYALVIAPVNRQLLDLLFSLVYMLDDFGPRSLDYQRAGWREAREEYHKFKTEYSSALDWRPFFSNYKESLERMALLYSISEEEQKDPALIPYWKHPGDLKDEKTPSRTFLRWLDKWLYGDTSAQAHLSFGGLITVAPFLAADLVGGSGQQIVEGRMAHMHRFHQFSRTALVTLAIANEVDKYCDLGNVVAISYLWAMFCEFVPEGKEMYKARYEALAR
jgi:hypothetical protein